MAENADGTYSDQREPWEPRQAKDWLEVDPFLRALSAAEYSIPSTEAAVFSFHAAWTRMPPDLRAQVWREREIAAALIGLLRYWRRSIPGLYSVGVGLRSTPEPRLSAVVTLEHPLTAGEWRELRQTWAEHSRVKSAIPQYNSGYSGEPIPIITDLRPAPVLLGQVAANAFLLGDPDPTPPTAPVLQSGDRIGSESPSGIREFGTLTCIVSDPGSTIPLLLASRHVMERSSYNVISGGAIPTCIGKVGRLVDCDAAVCSLISPYLCDYRLKGANIVPAAPVLATSDLPVQMYGAKSGHQLGYINKVCQVPANATKSGIFPLFTADISCAHGDSGALLITGRGATSPIPSWQAGYMSPAYIESMTCAMLGMLKAGPPPGADPNLRPEAYFTPMLEVFNDLRVEAWVR